jgi:hypothetical protein
MNNVEGENTAPLHFIGYGQRFQQKRFQFFMLVERHPRHPVQYSDVYREALRE